MSNLRQGASAVASQVGAQVMREKVSAAEAEAERAERKLKVEQPVERAIFGVAGRPEQALIPGCSWLRAALHTPGKPWSRLAPFQG